MSDGCPHAGIGSAFNFGWKREDIIEFLEPLSMVGYTAKNLSTVLVDECNKLYGGQPGDDATACVVRIRHREPMNILFGPPSNRDDCNRMMSLFFSKEGKHIVCGGTTSSIAAKYLGKPVKASLNFERSDVPPIATIEGVDLVTEGVITVNKVLEYARDYLETTKATSTGASSGTALRLFRVCCLRKPPTSTSMSAGRLILLIRTPICLLISALR